MPARQARENICFDRVNQLVSEGSDSYDAMVQGYREIINGLHDEAIAKETERLTKLRAAWNEREGGE